jgi:hypothetical protein
MSDEDFDAREQALRYAAGLKGLALVRTGDTFALAEIKIRDATLDEIAAYLDAEDISADRPSPNSRRADLRALLKAEHAMLAELETARRKADAQNSDRATTEAALAEIRRRIAELSQERDMAPPGWRAREP